MVAGGGGGDNNLVTNTFSTIFHRIQVYLCGT